MGYLGFPVVWERSPGTRPVLLHEQGPRGPCCLDVGVVAGPVTSEGIALRSLRCRNGSSPGGRQAPGQRS
jgi:hypothetical protein